MRQAPPGCNTDPELACDPTDDATICASSPHAPLHQGIWQNDCINFCRCQGYHGCVGDVGFELPPPPPPPLHKFSNGDTFEGELAGGKMHGRGTYRYANGNTYQGFFKDGKQNDPKARFEFANGDVYEGPYVSGRRETAGEPTAVYRFAKDGKVYRGPFAKNLRHGAGATEEYPDGRLFEGSFLMGKREGIGRFVKANSSWDTFRYIAGKKVERLESSHGAALGPL